jgi:hypothetical protein
MSTTTFFCHMDVPISWGEDRYKYVPIIGVFRDIPRAQLDHWVMRPDGRPRSDRDLASEVLVEIRRPLGTGGHTLPHTLDIADVLQLDRAAAIVVSTFLAALPSA